MSFVPPILVSGSRQRSAHTSTLHTTAVSEVAAVAALSLLTCLAVATGASVEVVCPFPQFSASGDDGVHYNRNHYHAEPQAHLLPYAANASFPALTHATSRCTYNTTSGVLGCSGYATALTDSAVACEAIRLSDGTLPTTLTLLCRFEIGFKLTHANASHLDLRPFIFRQNLAPEDALAAATLAGVNPGAVSWSAPFVCAQANSSAPAQNPGIVNVLVAVSPAATLSLSIAETCHTAESADTCDSVQWSTLNASAPQAAFPSALALAADTLFIAMQNQLQRSQSYFFVPLIVYDEPTDAQLSGADVLVAVVSSTTSYAASSSVYLRSLQERGLSKLPLLVVDDAMGITTLVPAQKSLLAPFGFLQPSLQTPQISPAVSYPVLPTNAQTARAIHRALLALEYRRIVLVVSPEYLPLYLSLTQLLNDEAVNVLDKVTITSTIWTSSSVEAISRSIQREAQRAGSNAAVGFLLLLDEASAPSVLRTDGLQAEKSNRNIFWMGSYETYTANLRLAASERSSSDGEDDGNVNGEDRMSAIPDLSVLYPSVAPPATFPPSLCRLLSSYAQLVHDGDAALLSQYVDSFVLDGDMDTSACLSDASDGDELQIFAGLPTPSAAPSAETTAVPRTDGQGSGNSSVTSFYPEHFERHAMLVSQRRYALSGRAFHLHPFLLYSLDLVDTVAALGLTRGTYNASAVASHGEGSTLAPSAEHSDAMGDGNNGRMPAPHILDALYLNEDGRTPLWFAVTRVEASPDSTTSPMDQGKLVPSSLSSGDLMKRYTYLVGVSTDGTSTAVPEALQQLPYQPVEPACAEGNATCARSLIIPVTVGVIVFLIALMLIFYTGRQRVSSSLFEKTRRAEYFARLARQEAEVKASFLANMSHEIRTPLHAILSMSRLLFESKQSQADASQQDLSDITQLIKSSEVLHALVNDILFISKMQTSNFSLSNREFDVCALVEDITNILALRWQNETVECVCDLNFPDFSFNITADPLRLRQVLTNLSTNAMKFTTTGNVTLRCSLVELNEADDYASPENEIIQHLLFVIKDTGEGMTQETLHRLFERFFQGKTTISKAAGGTGLGLAISAELVSMMGGTIGVWSEGKEKGSEFWFTLPTKYVPPSQACNKVQGSTFPENENCLVARVAYEPSAQFISGLTPITPTTEIQDTMASALGDRTVFVCEPNEGVRDMIMHSLSLWGFKKVYAGNSYAEAYTKFKSAAGIGDTLASPLRAITPPGQGERADKDQSSSVRKSPSFLGREGLRFSARRSKRHSRKKELARQALAQEGYLSSDKEDHHDNTARVRRSAYLLATDDMSGLTTDSGESGCHAHAAEKGKPFFPDIMIVDMSALFGDESPAVGSGSDSDTPPSQLATSKAANAAPWSRVFDSQETLFIFLCSDNFKRTQQQTNAHRIFQHTKFHILLSKPVTRKQLWDALNGIKPSDEAQTSAALTRQDAEFSFRRLKQSKREHACSPANVPSASSQQQSSNNSSATASNIHSKSNRDVAQNGKIRLLIAEDNNVNMHIAKRFLAASGYTNVDEAPDGLVCIDKFKKNAYDIILMDCQMPHCDGYQATKVIREVESKRGKPPIIIIAMTAFSMPDDRDKCVSEGMNDYVAKPFSEKRLIDVLDKWSELVQREQEKRSASLYRNKLFSRRSRSSRRRTSSHRNKSAHGDKGGASQRHRHEKDLQEGLIMTGGVADTPGEAIARPVTVGVVSSHQHGEESIRGNQPDSFPRGFGSLPSMRHFSSDDSITAESDTDHDVKGSVEALHAGITDGTEASHLSNKNSFASLLRDVDSRLSSNASVSKFALPQLASSFDGTSTYVQTLSPVAEVSSPTSASQSFSLPPLASSFTAPPAEKAPLPAKARSGGFVIDFGNTMAQEKSPSLQERRNMGDNLPTSTGSGLETHSDAKEAARKGSAKQARAVPIISFSHKSTTPPPKFKLPPVKKAPPRLKLSPTITSPSSSVGAHKSPSSADVLGSFNFAQPRPPSFSDTPPPSFSDAPISFSFPGKVPAIEVEPSTISAHDPASVSALLSPHAEGSSNPERTGDKLRMLMSAFDHPKVPTGLAESESLPKTAAMASQAGMLAAVPISRSESMGSESMDLQEAGISGRISAKLTESMSREGSPMFYDNFSPAGKQLKLFRGASQHSSTCEDEPVRATHAAKEQPDGQGVVSAQGGRDDGLHSAALVDTTRTLLSDGGVNTVMKSRKRTDAASADEHDPASVVGDAPSDASSPSPARATRPGRRRRSRRNYHQAADADYTGDDDDDYNPITLI